MEMQGNTCEKQKFVGEFYIVLEMSQDVPEQYWLFHVQVKFSLLPYDEHRRAQFFLSIL